MCNFQAKLRQSLEGYKRLARLDQQVMYTSRYNYTGTKYWFLKYKNLPMWVYTSELHEQSTEEFQEALVLLEQPVDEVYTQELQEQPTEEVQAASALPGPKVQVALEPPELVVLEVQAALELLEQDVLEVQQARKLVAF